MDRKVGKKDSRTETRETRTRVTEGDAESHIDTKMETLTDTNTLRPRYTDTGGDTLTDARTHAKCSKSRRRVSEQDGVCGVAWHVWYPRSFFITQPIEMLRV